VVQREQNRYNRRMMNGVVYNANSAGIQSKVYNNTSSIIPWVPMSV